LHFLGPELEQNGVLGVLVVYNVAIPGVSGIDLERFAGDLADGMGFGIREGFTFENAEAFQV
jgi:hypothetical protein